MELGPLEYVVFEFQGNHFRGDIVPALKKAVQAGTIRVIDIIFVRRDESGGITVLELEDLDPEMQLTFSEAVQDVTGMLSQSDVESIAELLTPNSSAAMMLFEHTWAKELRDAIAGANGRLVGGGLVAQEDLDATLAWIETESA
jgi:hypothetical protein